MQNDQTTEITIASLRNTRRILNKALRQATKRLNTLELENTSLREKLVRLKLKENPESSCVWASYSLGTSGGMHVECIDRDIRFSVHENWNYCPYCGRHLERKNLPYGISPGHSPIEPREDLTNTPICGSIPAQKEGTQ